MSEDDAAVRAKRDAEKARRRKEKMAAKRLKRERARQNRIDAQRRAVGAVIDATHPSDARVVSSTSGGGGEAGGEVGPDGVGAR